MEEKFGYTVHAEKAYQIITYAGMAKSHAMEGIYGAEENNFEKAKKDMIDAEKTISRRQAVLGRQLWAPTPWLTERHV